MDDLVSVQIYELDPMGKAVPGKHDDPATFEPYVGELIELDVLMKAVTHTSDGLVKCFRGYKNTAVAPPDGSLAVVRGKVMFYSERSGGRPFNNCLINAAMMVGRWMGYNFPADYDDVIRKAIPLPDYKPNGQPRGTMLWEVNKGLKALLPKPPELVVLSEQEIVDGLKRVGGRGKKKAMFAVVLDTTKLPPYYQRLVGQNYDGPHGWALAAKTPPPPPADA